MAIIRFNPFNPVFNPFGIEEENWQDFTMTQGINVYEEGDTIRVEAPVPGIPADKLDIQYEDGILRISGRMESDEKTNEGRVYHRMQKISSFNYVTSLPKAVDVKTIEATCENGIVTVSAHVADEVKPKKIAVQVKNS